MMHYFSDVTAFQRDPLTFLLERGNNCPEALLPLRLGFRPYYLVTDPVLARSILKTDPADIDKGRLIQKLRPFIGNSFLLSGGSDYVERRKVLHHQLARGVAQRYVPDMSSVIRGFAAGLARRETFDAHEFAAPLTLNLICVALFGKNALSSGDRQALIDALHLLEDELADEMFRATPLAPWTWLARRKRRKIGRKTMTFVVSKVRRDAGSSSVLRALEELELSDEQVTDEILTALVAGHHTTGTAGSWLLYHLATDPKLAARVAEEADAVCDDSGEIRPEALNDATTSLALVREVLRLYPSAWWFSREVKQPVELDGVKLSPGTSLIFSPWQWHRNPAYWDDPDRFDINRSHNNSAFMPFGAGPRVCVGMGVALLELQLLALEMSASFELTAISPDEVDLPKASVTLIPPKIEIGIRLRNGAAKEPAVAA